MGIILVIRVDLLEKPVWFDLMDFLRDFGFVGGLWGHGVFVDLASEFFAGFVVVLQFSCFIVFVMFKPENSIIIGQQFAALLKKICEEKIALLLRKCVTFLSN
jgi:hypothetical protein